MQGPEHPQLYVRAYESGQMVAHDPNLNGIQAVSIDESNLYFQNMLSSFRRARLLIDTPGPMTAEMQQAIIDSRKSAKESFLMATGITALYDVYTASEIYEAGASYRTTFQEYTRRYYTAPDRLQAAHQKRRELVDRFRRNQWFKQSQRNRQLEARPYAPEPAPTGKAKKERLSIADQKLDSQRKLEAIVIDPRAGFLPTHDKEKTYVLGVLDYLDNPDHPYTVNDQLIEIFYRTQKVRRRRENDYLDRDRVIVTLVYELEDYLLNAVESRRALEYLDVRLAECLNSRVTVAEEPEELEGQERGLIALNRYLNLLNFKKHGIGINFEAPLKVAEDRWADRGEGKHKVIGDQFTIRNIDRQTRDLLVSSAGRINIGEAKHAITSAIIDQTKRASFHRQILEQIATPQLGLGGPAIRMLRKASQIAQDALEQAQLQEATVL